MTWALILIVGLFSGTVAGIVGFGASVMLMPILVLTFGPLAAVPIMIIAGILGNLGRVLVWWREIDWRANAVYCSTAIPAGALGAYTLTSLDHRVISAILGAFFLVMIPGRHWLLNQGFRIKLPALALVGAGVGFLTGIVASTGPLNTPFFLAYGLVKGGFLGTEALGAVIINTTNAVTFRSLGALPTEVILSGFIIGASLMAGSWAAKWFVLRMDTRQFQGLVDAMMAVAGLTLLGSAVVGWMG